MPYYLITFTVPEGLRPWLRSHQKLGYGLLMKESAATLQDVARRDKYLGAELGFTSVLHTVGRQLQYHPHVHCVVAAGGLSADQLRWCRPPSADFFLPQPVLAARFRSRLRTALQSQPEAGEIASEVWRQQWVVDVQPVGSGAPALKYLSAYVYRPALSPQHLVADQDGAITLGYKDHEDHSWHALTLPAPEFIRRFLQQILPRGFQRVRSYGWLSPAARARWERVVTLLAWRVPAPPPPSPLPPRCPRCGRLLKHVLTLGRGPP